MAFPSRHRVIKQARQAKLNMINCIRWKEPIFCAILKRDPFSSYKIRQKHKRNWTILLERWFSINGWSFCDKVRLLWGLISSCRFRAQNTYWQIQDLCSGLKHLNEWHKKNLYWFLPTFLIRLSLYLFLTYFFMNCFKGKTNFSHRLCESVITKLAIFFVT